MSDFNTNGTRFIEFRLNRGEVTVQEEKGSLNCPGRASRVHSTRKECWSSDVAKSQRLSSQQRQQHSGGRRGLSSFSSVRPCHSSSCFTRTRSLAHSISPFALRFISRDDRPFQTIQRFPVSRSGRFNHSPINKYLTHSYYSDKRRC